MAAWSASGMRPISASAGMRSGSWLMRGSCRDGCNGRSRSPSRRSRHSLSGRCASRGVNFIMITLAFAQMLYYLASGLDQYGGDDGLIISTRSQFSLVNLTDRTQFYYLCAGLLLGAILLSKRMMDARFGWVVRGARSNERRMRALGFPIFGYRLLCFVIAGGVCGLAGALLANHSDFVSPAVMSWTRSGDLIVMVVFGGMESAFGPLIGAIVYLLSEEALSRVTEYWQLILGPLLLLVAVAARGGLYGLLAGLGRV